MAYLTHGLSSVGWLHLIRVGNEGSLHVPGVGWLMQEIIFMLAAFHVCFGLLPGAGSNTTAATRNAVGSLLFCGITRGARTYFGVASAALSPKLDLEHS